MKKALIVQLLAMPLPWPWRRAVLNTLLGYKIAPTARIGISIVQGEEVCLEAGARVGSLTLVKGLKTLRIGENGRLGNLNWVTGLPLTSSFFSDQPERDPSLVINANASVTHRHLIDCTDRVEVGSFTTLGGWGTQILTHSIDVTDSRQRSAPVRIGEYTFIGTRAVFLKGSILPDRSILAAGSVLAHAFSEPDTLYSGVPAKAIKALDPELAYFKRKTVGVF